MNKDELIEELKKMTPKELGSRLINPKLSNKQRQEILKIWYSIRIKHIDNSDKL